MQTKFTAAKMRATLYAWHGGQFDPLYAAASSGLVEDIAAVQEELLACAEWLWSVPSSFRKPDVSGGVYLRAAVYREDRYLRALAAALPRIIGPAVVHPRDGRTYRTLPWANMT